MSYFVKFDADPAGRLGIRGIFAIFKTDNFQVQKWLLSCSPFCASMELTEGIDFSKSVFFAICEFMFWMMLQSHRVY